MSLPRALIWIISVSLALHLFGLAIVIIVSGPSVLSFGDGVLYLELARNLKDGLGFVSLQTNGLTSEVFRAPGLPLLLEPFVGSVNGLLVYFTLFTTVASVVLPLCTWRIAREFLSDRAAFIAAGIVAFEPVAIFFSWFPFGEIPFLIFTLIAITLFIETSHCERKFSRFVFAAVAGLFAGYAILIRPANAPLFFVGIILAVLLWFKKKEFIIRLIVLCTALFVVLIPWYTHVHAITGTYSLSGNGWRNVYTDYLASLRSVKNVSSYDTERAYLKDKGSKELGLSDRYDLNNPANQALLRQVSIQELTQNVVVVLRLEPMLLLSFFTNDGYYYNAARVGFLPSYAEANISPTALFTKTGFAALSQIGDQLKRQFFVPIFGRIMTVILFGCAIFGAFIIKNRRVSILVGSIILLSAIDSTALGFGVEARLRLAVLPLIALFVAAGIDLLCSRYMIRRSCI